MDSQILYIWPQMRKKSNIYSTISLGLTGRAELMAHPDSSPEKGKLETEQNTNPLRQKAYLQSG